MDLRLEFQEQRPETHDHDDDFPCVIHYLPNGLLLKYHHGATPAISFFFFFFYCLSTYRPYSILYEFHCLSLKLTKQHKKKRKNEWKNKGRRRGEGEKRSVFSGRCFSGSVSLVLPTLPRVTHVAASGLWIIYPVVFSMFGCHFPIARIRRSPPSSIHCIEAGSVLRNPFRFCLF